ncbi:MAG TPA: TadE/TadG family type IV pilus assembly protein [Novosphingobium sp.]|nr:TadE/TadG family type IV pilus assembly protein [Novosphingobium sp.]
MVGSILRVIRDIYLSRRGNAATIVALCLPALIGAAGFAVDVGQWYMWKRELQHSVDQAAMAGAWALTNSESRATYKTRAVQEYDANQKITANFDTDPVVNLANFTGGSLNSVVVSASASQKLPFSSFLTGRAAVVRVRAQASFSEGSSYHACLVALKKTGEGLEIGGNAQVNARCGLAALSCDDNAIEIDGSASVETDSIAACGKVNVPPENESVVVENVTGLKDAYADLVPPTSPGAQTYSCKTTGGKKKTQLANLQPGTYAGGITVKCETVLAAGVYVIDGGVLDLTANYNVSGDNVMFVLKNGAQIKLGGNGNGNSVTLSPMESGPFKDILIFEDRNSHPASPGHKLNGNSNSLIEGLIYLPNGEIEILGTADVASQCLQISAFKIKISGNAHLETLCPVDVTTEAGTSAAIVRLVG